MPGKTPQAEEFIRAGDPAPVDSDSVNESANQTMKNTRREFLAKLGITVGAVSFGKNIMNALPSGAYQKEARIRPDLPVSPGEIVDFRYSPKDWQSTYCFPDDPSKNLVGRLGDLRCSHPGIGKDEKIFPHRVSFGLSGKDQLAYLDQKLEKPSVPVITTKLDGGDVIIETMTFATRDDKEGRVDNVIFQIYPKSELQVSVSPEVTVLTDAKVELSKIDRYSIVKFVETGKIFFVMDDPGVELKEEKGLYRIQCTSLTVSIESPFKLFMRLPQDGQEFDKLEGRFGKQEELLQETRGYWENWKPTDGKVAWKLNAPYEEFRIACARNILQSREIKDGKKIFQVGPTCYRGLWIVDGHFLLEAARYMGYDKEAHEGLVTIWDRQNEKGLFSAGAGETHWKDTAVAVYALIRQAELSQNWDYFSEMYPDAFEAIYALRDLVLKAKGDGSTNGSYGLLPRGFGDSGIGGVRDEYTNTLWTLIATKALHETAKRLQVPKVVELDSFFGELWFAFKASTKKEMKKHPGGFSYLPMLMSSDPRWKETDERKQPRPQAAQIYLSHAVYPGKLFKKTDPIPAGHLKLMESIIKEDIPIETGWLANDALWPYNAAIFAQAALYLGKGDMARKVFLGFLNHASPLYAWREEQSLQDAPVFDYIGDMPHNWASAECVRYLRHRIILEEEANLSLALGIGLSDLDSGAPFGFDYSPTKWGRVSVNFDRIDDLTWKMKYRREDFNEALMPPIEYVTMPAKLSGKYSLLKTSGVKYIRNGDQIFIKGNELEWECLWKNIK